MILIAGDCLRGLERRTAHMLPDVRLPRVPEFATPNVIASCCHFAIFAIFFFTALYLAEVTGYCGFRIAALFLPMTAVTIAVPLAAWKTYVVLASASISWSAL